ncbi:PAS/PAC sensor signal transduction histidine kinase [Trichormus variabilis ATCC 29413]|uniref:histidine kinase n=2 Tax=Anabaena variabilis TaxID=264691 RepID=Q3M3F4_TRIV2|nr:MULTISPECIES: PAS domain-containing protein [Nostocaceae]ABA24482.1 PAS/PAC sensor signal transduction histidine kinase [Trichormus variabilis ATCC 29413]MBC1216028.1 PAS domain-containing protein [Trichormus variabilis ARAD]MBC1254681.1 PAS domain-containing protein [Trichormus variabilis V5]MBC1267895.1 PAS domain-containing protein [Trichormus variabilis FSR]MBC1302168.1 PAS domain-containing protein [Trichormus variabilis N2B]
MTDNLVTIDKNTYDSLQQELIGLRQVVAKTLQLGLLIEYIPAAIAIFDSEMRYLLASRRWREDYDLVDENIVGRSHHDVCPEITLGWQNRYECCLAGNTEKSEEETLIRRDGTIDWVKWEINPWYEPSGEVGGLAVVSEVITPRKQSDIALADSERRLRDTEARLQRLADNLPGMLYEFCLKPDGTMTFPYVSSGCRELIERSPQELQDDASLIFANTHPEDMIGLQEAIANSAKTLQNFEYEWRIITSSGQIKWVQGVSRPERQPGGEITWYGYLLDISEQQAVLRERKQADQQLQQQAQLLQSIWEGVDYGICVLDVLDDEAEFRYVKINPAMHRISLLPVASFIGKTTAESLPPEIADLYRQRYQQCIKSRKSLVFEDNFLVNDKETWWFVNITPLGDSNSQISQLVVTATEITERKQAEQERQLFVSLIENSSDFIGFATLAGKPLFLNEAGLKLVGLDGLDALKNLHIMDFFFPEDQEYMDKHIMRVVNERGLWQGEYRFRNYQTHEEIPVDFNIFTVKSSETGKPLCLATVTRDIQERRKVEALLQEQEQFLRNIYEGVDQIIFVVDVLENLDFCYTGWNSTAERYTGITRNDAIGKAPEDIFGSVEGSLVRQRYKNCVEAGVSISFEDCLTFHNQETWWLTKINPLKNSAGRVYCLVGTTLDITQRKQNEIQLRQQAENLENTLRELQLTQTQLIHSEKMSSIGNMVAGVAHEINNPVNFIHGNLIPASEYAQDLLQLVELYRLHFPYPPEEIQEFIIDIEFDFLKEDLVKLLQSMRIGTQRIREIVLSLRNFSRLDEAEFKQVDIHEGIDSTLMILQNRLKAKSDHPEILVVKSYGDLPLIDCYPGQLNQVFMNLISNAIDALEEPVVDGQLSVAKPTIYIRSEMFNNNWVRVTISDNGVGIPQEILSKLFDPFFTTKSVGKGTGLGLSISYQIVVDRHNGKLTCNSTPGQGAEFIIEIPIHQ